MTQPIMRRRPLRQAPTRVGSRVHAPRVRRIRDRRHSGDWTIVPPPRAGVGTKLSGEGGCRRCGRERPAEREGSGGEFGKRRQRRHTDADSATGDRRPATGDRRLYPGLQLAMSSDFRPGRNSRHPLRGPRRGGVSTSDRASEPPQGPFAACPSFRIPRTASPRGRARLSTPATTSIARNDARYTIWCTTSILAFADSPSRSAAAASSPTRSASRDPERITARGASRRGCVGEGSGGRLRPRMAPVTTRSAVGAGWGETGSDRRPNRPPGRWRQGVPSSKSDCPCGTAPGPACPVRLSPRMWAFATTVVEAAMHAAAAANG